MTSFVKIAGGGLVGAFHFLLIWGLISQILMVIPGFQIARMYTRGSSVTGETVANLVPMIHGLITEPSKAAPKLKA